MKLLRILLVPSNIDWCMCNRVIHICRFVFRIVDDGRKLPNWLTNLRLYLNVLSCVVSKLETQLPIVIEMMDYRSGVKGFIWPATKWDRISFSRIESCNWRCICSVSVWNSCAPFRRDANIRLGECSPKMPLAFDSFAIALCRRGQVIKCECD